MTTQTFTFRSKGSADDWTTDTIEAETRKEASAKLDAIFGIVRDENGVRVSPDLSLLQVELLDSE